MVVLDAIGLYYCHLFTPTLIGAMAGRSAGRSSILQGSKGEFETEFCIITFSYTTDL